MGEVICSNKNSPRNRKKETKTALLIRNPIVCPPELVERYKSLTLHVDTTGYCCATYAVDRKVKRKCCVVDKLVWNIHNPTNQVKSCDRIVHKNSNKLDNRIENLHYGKK